MKPRVRWAGVAVLAMLSFAAPCLAQTDSVTTPTPILTPEPAAPAAPVDVATPVPLPAPIVPTTRTGMLPGRGSLGGQVGGSFFTGEEDYSAGAQPRFVFAGSFRYVMTPHLRWQVSPYFTWAAYKNDEPAPFPDPQFPADATKDRYLTQLVGGNAQLQFVMGKNPWHTHIGAGPLLYRVVVQNRRKVLKDPATNRLHQGQYLGGTAEFGVERFLKSLPNTSLELTLAGHMVFAKRADQFPSGFNSGISVYELRFGAHYYYDFNKPKKSDAASPAIP